VAEVFQNFPETMSASKKRQYMQRFLDKHNRKFKVNHCDNHKTVALLMAEFNFLLDRDNFVSHVPEGEKKSYKEFYGGKPNAEYAVLRHTKYSCHWSHVEEEDSPFGGGQYASSSTSELIPWLEKFKIEISVIFGP